MRISDLNTAGVGNASPSGASPTSGLGAYGQVGRGAYGQTSDQVQLSGASRLATSALQNHSTRLSELKSLVASGDYNPSADGISKSLVSEALARAVE